MQNSSGDKQRLLHILKAIEDIESFVADISRAAFFENPLIKSACVFQLQVIGEAANHLSGKFVENHQDVAWHQIVGTRNIIAHFYWGIDYVQIWEVIKKDLPALKQIVLIILSELE